MQLVVALKIAASKYIGHSGHASYPLKVLSVLDLSSFFPANSDHSYMYAGYISLDMKVDCMLNTSV